jgi:hypothetical protein
MVYALRSDLLLALERVERHTPLAYRHVFRDTGHWDTKAIPVWHSAAAVEDMGALGLAKGEDAGRQYFLILPQAVPFHLHEAECDDGSLRYFVNTGDNPASVYFLAGGPLGDAVIVPGEFSTTTPKPAGFDLLEAIRRAVLRDFAKVQCAWVSQGTYAYVGPAAYAAAEAGVRLVYNRNDTKSQLALPKPRAAREKKKG